MNRNLRNSIQIVAQDNLVNSTCVIVSTSRIQGIFERYYPVSGICSPFVFFSFRALSSSSARLAKARPIPTLIPGPSAESIRSIPTRRWNSAASTHSMPFFRIQLLPAIDKLEGDTYTNIQKYFFLNFTYFFFVHQLIQTPQPRHRRRPCCTAEPNRKGWFLP